MDYDLIQHAFAMLWSLPGEETMLQSHNVCLRAVTNMLRIQKHLHTVEA